MIVACIVLYNKQVGYFLDHRHEFFDEFVSSYGSPREGGGILCNRHAPFITMSEALVLLRVL